VFSDTPKKDTEVIHIGSLFENVKQSVTAKDAAERYGLKLTRNGMACCLFHPDRHPSMKVDERYYCFGCGETGDAIDLTAHLLGLRPKEAALQLAADFNIPTEPDSIRKKLRRKPMPKQPDPKEEERRCFRGLNDYYHRLEDWEERYRPDGQTEKFHPLFVEALEQKSYTKYLLDVLLFGSDDERQELVHQQQRRTNELEKRFQREQHFDRQPGKKPAVENPQR
jgi:hypothetical protein